MSVESALLSVVARHELDDSLAALAAVTARLRAQLLRETASASAVAKVPKRLLTAKEVSDMIGISTKTVYERRRELGGWKVGRSVRFDSDTVLRAVEEGL